MLKGIFVLKREEKRTVTTIFSIGNSKYFKIYVPQNFGALSVSYRDILLTL
jgi:hypothetical protein